MQEDTLITIHLLGSLGPGDHGKTAPKSVHMKRVRVRSPSPMELDDSNLDLTASEVLLGDNLTKTDESQPTACNSHESSPVPVAADCPDDSVVELEALQDELDELDWDESTQHSMEMSHESQTLKHHLHEKRKQVKKAEQQVRIQYLCSQLVETDHQLDMLRQKASVQPTSGKSSGQPMATSTPQTANHQDQS